MDSVNNQPPALGPQFPVYPPLLQLIRVTAATVPGPAGVTQLAGSSFLGPMLYVAFTQQLRTDSLLPRDREPCLADSVNGVALTPGFYHGRLSSSYQSLPVYEIIGTATGSGGSITVKEEDGNPTITGVTTLQFDEDFGMVVTDLSGGIAGVHVRLATASDPGIVSTIAQSFSGDKTFENDVIVEGSIISSDGTNDRVVVRFKDGSGSDGYIYARGQTGSPDYSNRKTLNTLTNGLILAEWTDLAETTNYDSGFAARDSAGVVQVGRTDTINGLIFYGGLCISGAITGFQISDDTLTAFAALTIAANSITIGTGADAFSQVTFGANTFPARASTGDLVAKTISDFGLSLVDDADAAAARITLEIGVGVPLNSYSSGNAGQIAYNGTYLFICVGSSSWGRVALDFSF